MTLTEIELRILRPDLRLRWTEQAPCCLVSTTVVVVRDDQAAEGIAAYDCYGPSPADRVLVEAVRSLAPALLGRDTDEWPAVKARYRVGVVFPFCAAPFSVIDVALHDLVARKTGRALCELFDPAPRHTIPAYASLETMPTVEDYLRVIDRAVSEGLPAVKVHGWGEPGRDVALLAQVREAHADLILMHDAEGVYDRPGALRVARALEDLGGCWLEAPLPDLDLDGYRELRSRVGIPILPAGYAFYDVQQFADALRDPPWSALRADLCSLTGLKELRQVAMLAEAFGLAMEPVSYGHALLQAANLHVMLSCRNVSFFEMPYPPEPWDYGIVDPLRPNDEGCMERPAHPGLGIAVDWERMDALTVHTVVLRHEP